MVGILWFIPLTVAQCVTARFGEYDVDHVLTYTKSISTSQGGPT